MSPQHAAFFPSFWWPSNTINHYFKRVCTQHSHSSIFCTFEPSTNTFAQLRVRNSQLDGKGELTSRRWWFPRSPTAPLQNRAGLSILWPNEVFSDCCLISCFHGGRTWELTAFLPPWALEWLGSAARDADKSYLSSRLASTGKVSQVQLMYLVHSSLDTRERQLWASPFYRDEKYTREKLKKSSIRFRNRISTSLHRHDAMLLFLLLFPKGSSSRGSIWGNVQPTCTQKQTVLIHSGISDSNPTWGLPSYTTFLHKSILKLHRNYFTPL